MMNSQFPASRARRPHPQWAYQTEKQPWNLPGRAKLESTNKQQQEAWGQQRPQRGGGGGRGSKPAAIPQQNGQHFPQQSPPQKRGDKQRTVVRHGPVQNARSLPADPFYQAIHIPPTEHGRLCTFFKNGDPVYHGLPVSVNRTFANLGSLLHYLTRELQFNSQHIFHWPHGFEVHQISDLEHQGNYIVTDHHPLDKTINYGGMFDPVPSNLKVNANHVGDDFDEFSEPSPENFPVSSYTNYNYNSPSVSNYPTGSKRAEDIPLYREYDPNDTLENYPVSTIRLINNLNRNAHVEISLSGSRKNYKLLLHDFGQFFGLRDCTLWTSRLPCKKVTSLAQLYVELEKDPQFLVCGTEEMPTEAAGLQHHSPPAPPPAFSPPGRSFSNDRASRRRVAKIDKPPPPPPAPPVVQGYSPRDDERLIRREIVRSRNSSPSIIFSPQGHSSRFEAGPTKANYVGHAKKPGHKGRLSRDRFSDNEFDDLPSSHFSGDGISMMNEEPMSPIRAARSFETLTRRNKPEKPQPLKAKPVTKAQLVNEGKIKRRVALHLEWVYGYRGKDARENMFFLPTGELLYYVGVVAVVYDPVNEVQRHYKAHTEDINCMALHPDEPLVVTGQISPAHSDQQPHVRVWNYQNLNTAAIIGLGVFQASICCVGFSPDGSRIMVLDEGDRHSLSVWKWSDDKQIAQTAENVDENGAFTRPTASDTIVWGKFCPDDGNLLITFGKEHLYFWKLTGNNKIQRDYNSGAFTEHFPQPKFITSATFLPNGDLITGDSNGSLLVWTRDADNNYVIQTSYSQALSQAHKKSVFAIVVTGPNHVLSGGGVEVKSWELKDGTVTNTGIQIILESSGFIRSLVVGRNSVIFAGTTKNSILEGALQGKFRYLVQGHSDEVWALSCHGKDSTFLTGGYDCQLIKWFAPIHRSVWRTPLEKQCLSVAFHPAEDVVAIGTSVGRLVVLNSYNGMHICSVQMAGSTDLLTCLQFAPEGDMIACGSQDGPLYISLVEDGGRTYRRHKAGIIESQMGAVQTIDWHDEIAELVQFSTQTGNHSFASIEDMKLVKVETSTISDEWSTYTCPTGKLAKAAMNRLKQGETLTACDLVGRNSPLAGLMASSTNFGRILLSSLRPDVEIETKLQESRMCSQNITALRFTSDGRYLIAVAGKEGSIYQYATNVTELWGGQLNSH